VQLTVYLKGSQTAAFTDWHNRRSMPPNLCRSIAANAIEGSQTAALTDWHNHQSMPPTLFGSNNAMHVWCKRCNLRGNLESETCYGAVWGKFVMVVHRRFRFVRHQPGLKTKECSRYEHRAVWKRYTCV